MSYTTDHAGYFHKSVRVYCNAGTLLATWVLDRPIAGLYVDEATGILYGTDVNADEQLVKWRLK